MNSFPGSFVTPSISSSSTITTASTAETPSPLASPSRKRAIEAISTPSSLSYCSSSTNSTTLSAIAQRFSRQSPNARPGSLRVGTHIDFQLNGNGHSDGNDMLSLRNMLAFSASEDPEEWLLPTPRANNQGSGRQAHHHQAHHHRQLHPHHQQPNHQQPNHQPPHQPNQQAPSPMTPAPYHHQHQHQSHQQPRVFFPSNGNDSQCAATGTQVPLPPNTPNLRYRAYQPDIVSSIFRR